VSRVKEQPASSLPAARCSRCHLRAAVVHAKLAKLTALIGHAELLTAVWAALCVCDVQRRMALVRAA
jgi:hypothetical protein